MGDDPARIALLDDLSPEARRVLLGAATRVRVTAGERLFRRDDPPGPLFVVLTGRMRAIDEATGAALRTMGRGAVVGELALVTGEPRSATVVADRDSSLLALPADVVEATLATEPSLARALLRQVAARLRTGRSAPTGLTTPATIALLAQDRAAPLPEVLGLLRPLLAAAGPVEVLERATTTDPAAAAERIDRLERAGSRVLLVGAPGDREWAALCRRQADATVRVTGQGDRPPPGGGAPGAYAIGPGGDLAGRVALLARRLTGRSVGVVLSGGGARGCAHIGALDALAEAGVVIDRVGGCSSGALIGGLLACGLTPDEIALRCRQELVDRNPLRDYTLPLVSLLRGQDVRDMLVRCFGDRTIEALPRDYFCVSVDLVSSTLVVHRTGPVDRAVGASMSLPGIGPPVVDGERLLVDGGVLDNLPVATMAATGEGPVVAVDVSAPFVPPAAADAAGGVRSTGRPRASAGRAWLRAAVVGDAGGQHSRLPSLRETLMRSVTLGAADEAAAAAKHAALVIRPPVQDAGLFAFARLDELRARGRAAALRALAEHPDWADLPPSAT